MALPKRDPKTGRFVKAGHKTHRRKTHRRKR